MSVHSVRSKTWQHELVALAFARFLIRVTARASVPADVMKLLLLPTGVSAMDHLTIRLALRINVDS